MICTENYLVLMNESDLKELVAAAQHHRIIQGVHPYTPLYEYFHNAFIRTYDLNTFPSYYKRSSDGHTWDKIPSRYFKQLVIQDLD